MNYLLLALLCVMVLGMASPTVCGEPHTVGEV
jgi:hypothetical protein